VGAPAVGLLDGIDTPIRFADRRNGYVYRSLDGPLYATHDGGATWNPTRVRNVQSLAVGGGEVFLASVSESTAIVSPVSGEPRLFRTRDAGRTRRRLVTTPRNLRIEKITFRGLAGIALVQAGADGMGPNQIWRSADGGVHWTRLILR
jgi:photosystem II stability/assembly factor-like uncharacterized protein